jgi:hypothetical protein
MEADWEIELGGGAPVIEALWPGFVDLRGSPERIGEIAEAAIFPALAGLLVTLNGADSPVWSAKCDLWEPEPDDGTAFDPTGTASACANPAEARAQAELACYVDLLPRAGEVFARREQAEEFCREWVARLALAPLPDCRAELIARQAIAGDAEGFGVTAYLSATGLDQAAAGDALAAALAAFADAIAPAATPSSSGGR